MTRYTVVWLHEAQDDLTRIWMAATDRTDVNAAAEIDLVLRDDPEKVGTILVADVRLLKLTGLGILFRILDLDRIVQVTKVVRVHYPRRNGSK